MSTAELNGQTELNEKDTLPVPTSPAIVCKNVYKTFLEPMEGSRSWDNFFLGKKKEVSAVKDVSFDVQRNEVFGLLGPNGSGKSTLIRMISTLLYPDQGTLTIFGYDVVKEQFQIRKFINRVSVEASFFKKLSAMENLRYAARLYNIPNQGTEISLSILERLGIKREKAFIPLEHLSRGMQQKVAIARAMMTSPTLILLDEPTTGLDPKSKRDVQEFIEEVMREHDATIFLTTHDMDEAERLCDRIAIINKGEIIALDTAEKLKEQVGTDSLEDVFFKLTGKSWELGDTDE